MKHTTRAEAHLVPSDIAGELDKVEALVARGLCDSYILLGNARVSGEAAAEIKAQLKARGVSAPIVLGGEWLSQTIRDSQRLRALVPRVYGLGDLSQILDERIYAQTQALLESLKDDLATFVVTEAYRAAVDALERHGFVLLIGEPGAGKSVTAATLAAAAGDLWGLRVVQVDNPAGMRQWNPNEPQLLWADDAFGVTNVNLDLLDPWNRTLSLVRAMVRNGSRIVLTSRDYIWHAARRQLKESSFPFLVEDKVTIEVTSFTANEKEQILYTHLRAGGQPREFRALAKPHLRSICERVELLPETARRFANPFFTTEIDPGSPDRIEHFLTNPKQYLKELLDKLDNPREAAVALVFAHSGALACPFEPSDSDVKLLQRLGADEASVRLALDEFNGSLLRTDLVRGAYHFRHPSVGDAYAELLTEHPEKLAIWLVGAPLRQILSDAWVDIDDPDRHGVSIPPNLWPQLRIRLDGAQSGDATRVLTFLAERCSPAFARAHLEEHPDLLRPLTRPGMYLYSGSPAVLLLALLEDRGILPEPSRREFAEHVGENAVEGPDPAWCSVAGVRRLLREQEFNEIRERVRVALITDEARAITDFWDTSNYPGVEWGSPESYVDPLREAVAALRREFTGDEEAMSALSAIDEHAQYLEERLYEYHPEYDVSEVATWKPPTPPASRPATEATNPSGGRDPFDDVDS